MITRYKNLYNKHEEEKCDRIFSLKKCGLLTKKSHQNVIINTNLMMMIVIKDNRFTTLIDRTIQSSIETN